MSLLNTTSRALILIALAAVSFMACQKESSDFTGETPTLLIENGAADDRGPSPVGPPPGGNYSCDGAVNAVNGLIYRPNGMGGFISASFASQLTPGKIVIFGSGTCSRWNEGWHNPDGLKTWLANHPTKKAIMVYTYEAHPISEGGGLPVYRYPTSCEAISTGLYLNQHSTLAQRWAAWTSTQSKLGTVSNCTHWIDNMSNSVTNGNQAWPFRVFVVCNDGRLVLISMGGVCDIATELNNYFGL